MTGIERGVEKKNVYPGVRLEWEYPNFALELARHLGGAAGRIILGAENPWPGGAISRREFCFCACSMPFLGAVPLKGPLLP